jgi:UDP-galactopyranose mutase
MSVRVEYLIVGSGLTGATIARLLTDAGKQVLVLERRSHLGGNVHNQLHPSGIPIHTYGPHYFRTNSLRIWNFVNRFASFHPYEAVCMSWVADRYENWPIAASYVRRVAGEHWKPAFQGEPANFEQAALKQMPRIVYEGFVKGYTEKQWGVPARCLSAALAKRFDVRADDDPRLVRHKYQGIPLEGYTSFVRKMLDGIAVLDNTDYLQNRDHFSASKQLIFTGPIDEWFGFDLGRLQYRAQKREHSYLPAVDLQLPCGQVNNPDAANGAHIRTLEWKHFMPASQRGKVRGTVLTRETPYSPIAPDAYEYPFPNEQNAALYGEYRRRADAVPNLTICGRLGEYRYYDMDQAIGRAMIIAQRWLGVQLAAPSESLARATG